MVAFVGGKKVERPEVQKIEFCPKFEQKKSEPLNPKFVMTVKMGMII